MILMHETTYQYIKDYIESNCPLPVSVQYSGEVFNLNGHVVKIDNSLKPTINEGTDWIFPKEKFITYEKSDESWCRYFGIGRQGTGFVLGEIILNNSIFSFFDNVKRNKPRQTWMTKNGPKTF